MTPVLVGGRASHLANHLTSQLKPATTTTTSPTLSTSKPTSVAAISTADSDVKQDETASNKSTATQVLEASTLLQQQGGGELGGASGGIPSITAELIAQCFLNLPNSINNSTPTGSGSLTNDAESHTGDDIESVVMANDAVVSAANVLAALGGTLSEGNILSTIVCFDSVKNTAKIHSLKNLYTVKILSFQKHGQNL